MIENKKPSVTHLIDLLNKPALMKWANKIGLSGVSLDEYRDNSKQKGLSLHSQVERLFKEGIELEKTTDQSALDLFLTGKRVISFEEKIETEWFVGRYDLEIDEAGKRYLCDFKSSDGVYLETILQLTAYNMAKPSDGIAIIPMPSFKMKKIHIENFKPYEQILINLSEIYTIKMHTGWK